jgi:uncharacterized Zn finger protein (UPF0148 family)
MSAHCDKCDTDLWQDSEGNFICPVCTKDTRIQELEGEVLELKNRAYPLQLHIKKLESLVRELVGALEKYADRSEWTKHYTHSAWALMFNSSEVDGDGYVIAEQALAHAKQVIGEGKE